MVRPSRALNHATPRHCRQTTERRTAVSHVVFTVANANQSCGGGVGPGGEPGRLHMPGPRRVRPPSGVGSSRCQQPSANKLRPACEGGCSVRVFHLELSDERIAPRLVDVASLSFTVKRRCVFVRAFFDVNVCVYVFVVLEGDSYEAVVKTSTGRRRRLSLIQ